MSSLIEARKNLRGKSQERKKESGDSKDQGNYRKGSTSRMERGLVLVSFPVRLLKSDDCGNKTEEVQRGHDEEKARNARGLNGGGEQHPRRHDKQETCNRKPFRV